MQDKYNQEVTPEIYFILKHALIIYEELWLGNSKT
jgi:hypothetical protein